MAKVIQADRVVAGQLVYPAQSAARILGGRHDDHPTVQAFAAHREASTAKLEDDLAIAVLALRNWECRSCEGGGLISPIVNGRMRKEKCLACDGTGNHPTAREALTRIQGEYRCGEVADA